MLQHEPQKCYAKRKKSNNKSHTLNLYEMSRKSKSTEKESRLAVAWDWDWEWGLTVFRQERSCWDDENSLKMDCDDYCTLW